MQLRSPLRSPLNLALRSAFSNLGGGVSGPSLPQSASIVFNMKADSLALADNATVSTWTDSSANALAFTGTGVFKTNQLGTKPCVRFTGAASQYMTAIRAGTALNTATSSRICTTMIVGKANATNSVGCMFGSTAGGNAYFAVIDGTQASSTIGRYHGNTTECAPAVNATNMFVSAFTSLTSNPNVAGNPGLERQYLNGTCVRSANTAAPAPADTTFSIGAVGNGNLPAKVDLFDIVVWDRTLTPAEIFQATNYFYEKYSQTKPWASVSNIVVYDGDSITNSVGSTNVAGSYPYQSAQSLGLAYGQWTNLGIGSITMSGMIAKLPEWNGIGSTVGKGMRVAAFEYFNQRGDATAIETQNNLYAATVRGYTNTKLALGTSTSSTFDPAADRTAMNAYYDVNFASHCDAYVALHNDTNIGISGAAATDGNTVYFSDGVHLKNAGYTVLAGMFTTGLQAIP